jgi:hypothetical protein
MYGSTGSLNRILEYCLISASVSKDAAGWSHPIANSASAAADCTVYAAYTPPSGSQMTLFVNDNAPNAGNAGKEAWLTGWENITSLCNAASTANVGGGTGQFPTPAQLLTVGNVVCRKSAAADNTSGRYWVCFADASTFYLCVQTGDAAATYMCIMFGDIFSLAGSSDTYRCLLIGRGATGQSTAWAGQTYSTPPGGYDSFACTSVYSTNVPTAITSITIPLIGHFMPRTYGGTGNSINVGKVFDISKQYTVTYPGASQYYGIIPMGGLMPSPNGSDNSFYMSPVQICESNGCIRGRMRGIWQVCHSVLNFSDGQIFAGGGDFAGKTFMIVKRDISGGFFAVEISNTVETN